MHMITEAVPATMKIELVADRDGDGDGDGDGDLRLTLTQVGLGFAVGYILLGEAEAEQLATQLRGPLYSTIEYENSASQPLNENDWIVFRMNGLGRNIFLTISDAAKRQLTARLTYDEAKRLAAHLAETTD